MKNATSIATSLIVPFVLAGCLSVSTESEDAREALGEPAPEAVAEGAAAQTAARSGGKDDLVIIPIFPNLLYNPAFETPDPLIPSGFIDHGSAQAPWFAGWGTAAASWPATSNDLEYGAIATWLRTDVVHTAGGRSMLVSATTNNGGIAQQYWTNPSPPANNNALRFSVWVYTVAGQVTIGLGSGGTGFVMKSSTKIGQWEYLETCGTSFNNEVLIYTLGGPSVYYVDDANVSATVSPITNKYCIPAS